jgi:folate-dependent phosphoribosylglycinamide formyltransferase PurN
LPALNALFAEWGDQIGLVVLSNRFGGRHGGLVRQLTEGIRRSGVRLTLWLGFDIVAAQAIAAVAPLLGRRRSGLLSVRALARRHGAQVIETNDVNDARCLDSVRAQAPDVVLVMNFDQILRPSFISVPRYCVLNIHPSLLPALRGPCPAFWALFEGRDEVGVTLHLIEDRSIDSGPIVRREALRAPAGATVAELTAQLFARGVGMLGPGLSDLLAGGIERASRQSGPASYQGFPTARDMAEARRRGVRMFRLGYLARLLASAIASRPPS